MRVVALDGPAGAGKSTVARAVAATLGWRHVDTGALYRALALAVLERAVDPSDEDAVAALARDADIAVFGDRVVLEGRDVTRQIRRSDVTELTSKVAALPEVRRAMLSRQRAMASGADTVMEGRDIGTAVFPDAAVKVWLTASVEERARRRHAELATSDDEPLADITRSIAARDQADSSRAVSPLRPAPDAVVVDTTGRTVGDVVREIVGLVKDSNSRV